MHALRRGLHIHDLWCSSSSSSKLSQYLCEAAPPSLLLRPHRILFSPRRHYDAPPQQQIHFDAPPQQQRQNVAGPTGKPSQGAYLSQQLAKDVSKLDPRHIGNIIRICGEENRLDEGIAVLRKAIASFRSDQYVIEAAFHACFAANASERASDVLAVITEFGIAPSELVISSLIAGYCRTNHPANAYETFQFAREKQMALSNKDNWLLKTLIENSMIDEAHVVLQAMVDTKEKYKLPDEQTWSNVAKAAAKLNNAELPFELFKKFSGEDEAAIPPAFWSAVIAGLFNRQNFAGAMHMWERCKKAITPNGQMYNMLITHFSKAQHYEQVMRTYNEAKQHDVQLDEITYNLVLTACSKGGHMERVKEIVDRMKKSGVQPNLVSYSVLLEGYVKANDFTKALELLEQMKQEGLKPTITMWSLIVHGLGKAKQMDRAYGVLEELRKEPGLELVTYGNVLNSLFKARLGEYSMQNIEELRASGIQFDENLRNVVMLATDKSRGANFNQILDEMDAAGLQPDEPMFNLLIEDCIREKNLDQARLAIQRMQEHYKITPSRVTWSIFMKGLGQAGLVDETIKVFEAIPTPARTAYEFNTIIHQMIRNYRMDVAVSYFDMMSVVGVEPSEITANILINGFGRSKELDKCFEVFEAFRRRFGNMSAIGYNVLMSCCMMNRRPDRAVQLLDDMRTAGVQPISFLGWNVLEEGISKINRLEQSFELIRKDTTGIGAYGELMKVCVDCGRKDLVLKVTVMMKDSHVEWKELEAELQKGSPQVLAKVKEWLQEGGEVPLSEKQLQQIDAIAPSPVDESPSSPPPPSQPSSPPQPSSTPPPAS